MYQLHTPPLTLQLVYLKVSNLFQKLEGKKANAHAIIQSFVLPNCKLRKTAAEAEAQYKSEKQCLSIVIPIASASYYLFEFHPPAKCSFITLDHKPGQIETLTRSSPQGLQVIW